MAVSDQKYSLERDILPRSYLSRNIMQTHQLWIQIHVHIICTYNSFLEGFYALLGSRALWLQISPQPENRVWTEKGKLDRASLARSHHHHLSPHPGNKPGLGPFFLGCDLLWPLTKGWTIMEGLGPVETVWEVCWTRGPHSTMPVPHHLLDMEKEKENPDSLHQKQVPG